MSASPDREHFRAGSASHGKPFAGSAAALAVGAVFLVTALIAIEITRVSGGVALLWPPNGLAAALLIRIRTVHLPLAALAILLGGLIANVHGAGDPWSIAIGLSLVNLVEIGAMVGMFRFAYPFPYPKISIIQATIMTLVMGVLITGLGAVLGGATLHLLADAPFRTTALQWWQASALGACVFAPPVIMYSRANLERLLQRAYLLQNIAVWLLCMAFTWVCVRYVPFPFVVLAIAPMSAAFQLGAFGTSILSFSNAIVVIVMWLYGIKPAGLDLSHAGPPLTDLPFIALIAMMMPPIAVGLGTDARRQAARALKASERRFRESMEHSPLGMIILDRNGRWSFTNPALQKMLGYTADELADQTIESLAHPDEQHDIWERWGKLVSQEVESYQVERRFRHSSGQWIWTNCAVSLARDEEGVPLHFVAQVESLEERRHAEARLAGERELLRATLGSIGDAVVTIDASGRITYMNAAAVTLTGWPFEAAEQRLLGEILPLTEADSSAPVHMLMESGLREHGPVRRSEPCALARPDRSVRYVTDVLTPVFGSSREVVGFVVVIHDVTASFERTRDLRHRANHDPLTNLLNRAAFERELHGAFSTARQKGVHAALIALDLDRFKAVNDAGGHAAGDAVLRNVAATLQRSVRPGDCVGRIGGDEFAVLLCNCDAQHAREIAQRLLGALNPLLTTWDGSTYTTGASLGIAQHDTRYADPVEWMQEADAVCYESKRAGRGSARFA